MGKKLFPAFTAAFLSAALSLGAVGCLVTAFGLELAEPALVYFSCAGAACLFSLVFSLRWGGLMAACIAALGAGYLWHRALPLEQTKELLVTLSKFYHGAYNWGYFLFAQGVGPYDWPLGVLGSLISLAAARALVRQKSLILPLTLAALPLAACLVVTDTVPEMPWLFLFLSAFLLAMVPQSLRREDPVQGSRLTWLAAIPVAAALAGLLLAFPEESYVNHSKALQSRLLSLAETLPQRAQDLRSQLSAGLASDGDQSLDLKSLGPRPEYTYGVLELTTDTTGLFYLRGQDYDAYTGTGWTASPHRAEPFGFEGEPIGTASVTTRSKKELRFLPYYPAGIQTLAGGSLKNPEGDKTYSYAYTPAPEPEPEPESSRIELTDLEIAQFGSTADRLRYLTLPGQTRVKAEALLRTILPEGGTRREQAEAIADFVRSSAEYDLNTEKMPASEPDFALWFLEQGDTGYCVHFATAAVVLLRAADIPARYVTGYLAHTRAGEAVTVTAGDAHAWAEYYLPQQQAWVVLEATPAREEPRPTPTDTPGATETIPAATETPTLPSPTESRIPDAPPPTATEEPAPEKRELTLSPWLLLPLALLSLFLQYRLRLSLRQSRLAKAAPNEKALLYWQQTRLAAKLLKRPPPEALHHLAQKAKFSQHILTEEELSQFRSHLEKAHQTLKANPWYLQPVYRLIYGLY